MRELVFESTRFSDLLMKELLPWLRANYHISNNPEKNIIAGRSAGGLAACVTAWRQSEIFANVLSQSGSVFWKPAGDVEGEWFARQVATSARLPLRFYLDAGILETGAISNTTRLWKESDSTPDAISLLATNRHLRDVLKAKGYFVEYRERTGGHTDAASQATFFAQGLISLIGPKSNP
jgi:enterochelin esterase family protein